MAEPEYHLTDDEIEGYSMGALSGAELDRGEEHLLICESCRQRVGESDAYVAAMKRASERLREPKPRRWGLPWLVPVLAGAAFAALVILTWTSSRHFVDMPAVATVMLDATRGAGLMSQAPADWRLVLKPVLTGLPVWPKYRLEVVDTAGDYLWQGSYPGAVVGPLHAGLYFVRIYSPEGTLLREYGLEVEKTRR